MTRVSVLLMLMVTLVGGGVILLLNREHGRLSARLAQSETSRVGLEERVRTLQAERDRLRSLLSEKKPATSGNAGAVTSSSTLPAERKDGESANPAPAKSPKNPAAAGRTAFAEMMKNPAMKEMMKQQQIAALDSQYGPLFAQFQFTDEEKQAFKQLLGDRALMDTELGLQMMAEGVTPEQRADLARKHGEERKASDSRIRDFLNSDTDYAAFQQWEETKAERMQLDMGRSVFAGSGEPLSPQQEQQLITAMHEVNRLPSSLPDLSKPENFDPAHLTQADIGRQMARYDDNAQAVLQRAAQFLTPKQLDALRTMQQQWRAMSETGLRMSAMMFNGEANAAPK